MYRRIVLLILLVVLPVLVGCPGNRSIDKEANEAMWEWVEQQDQNGWHIGGFEEANYTNIIVDHQFRPTQLKIAITGDAVNPYHQRNLLGDLAMKWRDMYPANMRPRFNLRVTLYDMQMDRDHELGWCEIDQDGNIDTHHHRTQDVM
jgi:hypothetical protein